MFRNYFLLLLIALPVISFAQNGTVKITFVNTINDTAIVLNDKTYINPWGEEYIINQLKYYISNVSLQSNDKSFYENNSYHLIDESNGESKSFSFAVKAGNYSNLSFLIGVDSLMNVSGALSGALDPLNGMFWTWNSGYIMFKLEGTSPQSTVVNNKIEYHIGGFAGSENVLHKEELLIPSGKSLEIKEGKITEIIIEADINKLWNSGYKLKIIEIPACTSPGKLAHDISSNYSSLFFIKDVINN
jgi:hypothetical protein